MIYPQIPFNEWADRYQISLDAIPCPTCGIFLELIKPVALNGYRGLEAEICLKCNKVSGMVRLVPVSKEKLELWESLRPLKP